MAYGVRDLRKIELGKETTAGTAVAATTVWGGTGVLKDDREITVVEEDVGYLQPLGRQYVPRYGATIDFDEIEATFEQLPYLLAASVENVTTGAADGDGSGKIYQYDFATNAANTITTYTIEAGDNQRVDEMEYSFVEEWTLSGAKNEAVKMQGSWRGRQATDSDFTGALSRPTVEEILFNKGKLYIDATGGTIGTTQKTATWLGFTLHAVPGQKAHYTGDGNLYYTDVKQVTGELTGELVLEHDATGEAELGFARTGVVRLARMQFQGSALTTAGTTYTYKTLQIDLAIKYTDVPELGEDEGDNTLTLPFRAIYSTADNQSNQVIVVNELASLP